MTLLDWVFGMINDWDDLGYDDGTLPTQSMSAIL
jgi:hypothetical protein